MDQRQLTLEQKIVFLIRNAGGKMPLSDLLMYYKKTFHTPAPVPTAMKLKIWMKRFKSIIVDHNKKNNQTYILVAKSSPVYRSIPRQDTREQNLLEEKIQKVLRQNGNNVPLNSFAYKYREYFKEELMLPVGTRLAKWFQQFPSIGMENDMIVFAGYSALQTDKPEDVDEVLQLVKENDGCIGLSALADLYQRKYAKELLLPAGKKLSHWLCDHNYFVLTEKPSNNEVYVCIKHPVQCALDEASSKKQKLEEVEVPNLSDGTSTVSSPLSRLPPGFEFTFHNNEIAKSINTSAVDDRFERDFPPLVPTIFHKVTNAGVIGETLDQSSTKPEESKPANQISSEGETIIQRTFENYDFLDVHDTISNHNQDDGNLRALSPHANRTPRFEGAPSWQVVDYADQNESVIGQAARQLGCSLIGK